METNAVNPAAVRPALGSSEGGERTSPAGSAAAAADFETFLSLLTAQMRNQDPLKPLDSTEFVAQLANFSAVEQQIGANERLDAILDALSAGPGAGLAEWIGMEAETTGAAHHEGGPLDLRGSPHLGADGARLEVYRADGRLVGAVPIDPAAERIDWDGRLDGRRLEPGVYRFEAAYSAGAASLGSVPLRRDVRIADLRFGPEGPRLGLAGGGEIAPHEVEALRRPAAGA